MKDIESLAEQFSSQGLSLETSDRDPLNQFDLWYADACSAELKEPNGMVLSTVDEYLMPWQRTVLMKYYDVHGFVFFTNYNSQKAAQIANNQQVSVLFPWYQLHRQVFVQGVVRKVDEHVSARYFSSRGRGSQVGAWASKQSQVLDSRDLLDQNVRAVEAEYAGYDKLPLPPFWGGYLIHPIRYEFWQGRRDRLHDRVVYYHTSYDDSAWQRQILYP